MKTIESISVNFNRVFLQKKSETTSSSAISMPVPNGSGLVETTPSCFR